MGKIKGQNEYQNFKDGKKLTVKQAVKAHCYQCNGEEEGSFVDCQGQCCPLYPFFKKWVTRKISSDSTVLNKRLAEAKI